MGVESTLERAATVPALPATPAWNRALRDPRWALGSTLAVARARYVGRIRGNTMTLTVTLEDPKQRIGVFTLARNDDTLLTKCR